MDMARILRGRLEGLLDMQFARGWGARLRGALARAGVMRRKRLKGMTQT